MPNVEPIKPAPLRRCFGAPLNLNLRWLTWAKEHHAGDLEKLMPYVGDLEQVPRGWNLNQYLKALEDTECLI